MMRYLKVMVAVSAIFALAAIGVCGVEMFLVMREARNAVLGAAPRVKAQAAQIAGQAQSVLGSADASLRTLNKTLRTTNDAINQARDIERDNRADINEINAQTVMSLEKFNALLVSVDGGIGVYDKNFIHVDVRRTGLARWAFVGKREVAASALVVE